LLGRGSNGKINDNQRMNLVMERQRGTTGTRMHKRVSLVKDMALRYDLMKEHQHFITSIKVINGGYDEQNTCSWSQNLLEMVGLLDEMLYYALYSISLQTNAWQLYFRVGT
jgi:hypothetical protein